MMSKTVASALVLAQIGCAPTQPPAEEVIPEKGSSGRTCAAGAAASLVGRVASKELGSEAIRLTGAGALRWIPPGAMVTMDYRTDRVNVELDANNRVTRIRCG